MKGFSILVIVGAFVLATYSLFMDVTVFSGYGRVVNLHLVSQQQMYLQISAMVFVGGLALFFISRSKSSKTEKAETANYEEKPTENGFNYILYQKNDSVNFNNIKELISKQYTIEGAVKVITDNESSYMIKNDSAGYVELKQKEGFISLSIYKLFKPIFIKSLYTEKEQSLSLDLTGELLKLSDMLSKGLISEEEFKECKKSLIAKK